MTIINLDPDFTNKSGPYADVKIFKFPAGEIHVEMKQELMYKQEFQIWHRLKNADDIMELLLATDALRRKCPEAKISALFPYIPYARQDRMMNGGEPFSLKVFANLINSQNYDKVHVLEPHSDVSGALINNLTEMLPYYLLRAQDDIKQNYGEFVMVSPDGGALKRIYKHAQFMGYDGPVYCATKIRDLKNAGKIVRTTIDATEEELRGKTVVIDDDIISRGATFLHLTKALKDKGADKVLLAVAHHEGVADEEALKESGIDKIYTTNSIIDKGSDFVKIFRIDP